MHGLRLQIISVFIFGFCSCFTAFAQPHIGSISPTVGPVSPVGSPITITGTGFGASPDTVTIGGVTVVPSSWTDNGIVAPVPSTLLPGFSDVIVTVGGITSNAQSFLVIPVITAVSPANAAPIGGMVTVTGTSFGDAPGAVTFNGTPAIPSTWSNTSITFPIPSGATSGFIVVTSNGWDTNGAPYSILPAINGLSPAFGGIGSSVRISGNGFGASQGFGAVSFNGVSATVQPQDWTDTSIVTTVPGGATTGPVVVTAGNLFASAGVNFVVAPTLVSLALTPANPSITLGATQQLRLKAMGTYSDGSAQDVTANVTWTTSDSSVALVIPNPGVFGVIGISSVGTSAITATLDNISSSTVVTVTPPVTPTPPSVSSISPTSGAAGTTVTFSGSNFGEQQGTGSVWLGSTLATVITWSDSLVTATVSTGSSSGTARIQQGGTWSNAVAFTVNGPTISAVTPASGLPGTPVTISGSGFGTAQGSGQLILGTLPASVSTWNDSQIVASVAPGAASGAAQVLQNGSLSNAVTFSVNNPNIDSVTPNFGSAGTTVTITGSGFGATQDTGIAWVGSTQGDVTSWSDHQVQAKVDASAVSGIVRIQQNGVWSNAFAFKVPPSLSTDPSVILNPSLLSMVVGETRTLQAVDDSGQPLIGLTWASSDTSVATLSTDDPPVITAVAPGHLTIVAGTGSADLTIYPGPSLPLGTAEWSVPGDGSGVLKVLPAIPSDLGADVFALQESGTVQALTAEGNVLWASSVGTDKTLVPDFLGGLEIADSQSLTRINGLTGQSYPSYNFVNPNGLVPPVLVNTDGTVLTVDGDSVVGIDPITGVAKFSIQLEDSISSVNGNCGEFTPEEFSSPPNFGQPIIAGDGYAYFPYAYSTSPLALNNKFCFDIQNPTDGDIIESEFSHTDSHSRLLRVAPDGSFLKITVGDWTFDIVHECVYATDPPYNTGAECFHTRDFNASSGTIGGGSLGSLISNSDQGVFYSWDLGFSNGDLTHQLSAIDSAGNVATAPLPLPGSFAPVLQQEDGSLVGTLNIPPDPSGEDGAQLMVAMDASGIPKWSIPNYSPEYAQADGSVVATSLDGASSFQFDQNGASIGAFLRRTSSWIGQSYSANLQVASIAASPLQLAGTFAAFAGGNHSGTGVAIQQVLTNQQQTDEKQLPVIGPGSSCDLQAEADVLPPFPTCGNINAIELLTNKTLDMIFQTYLQTFLPGITDSNGKPNNPEMIFSDPNNRPINVTGPGQKINIRLEGLPRLGQGQFSVLTERVDPANHVISVVTLKGHPLAGWRYWRVYSIATNHIVVETGAYDQPGPGPKNYTGYYLALGTVSKGWRDFLKFIQSDIHAPRGSTLNHLGSNPDTIPSDVLLDGFWDLSGSYTGYILNNVCQAATCN